MQIELIAPAAAEAASLPRVGLGILVDMLVGTVTAPISAATREELRHADRRRA